MESLSPKLEALGRAVAEVSDRSAAPEATLAVARERLFAPQRVRRAPPRVAWAAAALVALAVMVVVGIQRGFRRDAPVAPRALSFVIDGEARSGAVGEWISADDERVELRFSEGSQLAVAPHSRARVSLVTPRGAEIVVEEGGLGARITPSSRTSWALRAGPFRVLVTGTVFDVAWEAAAQRFELTVEDGSVRVVGPHLPADRSVVAGEHLSVSVREGRVELARGPQPSPMTSSSAVPAADPSSRPSGEPAASSAAAPLRSVRKEEPAPTPEPWREHLRAGRHRDAISAAERQGFTNVLGTASNAELWQLVDAARFSGQPARAVATLEALRARGVRGNTAFLLGKIAADQQGAPGQASTWFQTYLREAPGGALTEEALGRLMQLQQRSSPAAARATAERYLARYPQGAYAGLAKRLSSR